MKMTRTLTLQIKDEDIQGAGHGSTDDPLARALRREYPGEWRTELHSQGIALREGAAWLQKGSEFTDYTMDEGTRKALLAFDEGVDFLPRTVVLTPVE